MIAFHKIENRLLTKNLKELHIVPRGDLHIGDPGFNEKAFKEMIYKSRYVPTLFFDTGDILNNGIKSSVSNCYKEVIAPGDDQIDYAVNLLQESAKYTGFGIPGNHCKRSLKEVNIDVARKLYSDLQVPYFPIHVLAYVQFGCDRHGDPINYSFYAHHGAGGGSGRPGKTKKMLDQSIILEGADCYLRSHSHLIDAFPASINRFNARTGKVYKANEYHISTGTWLDTSDYAEEMELPPLPIGAPTIILSGTEKKIEVQV